MALWLKSKSYGHLSFGNFVTLSQIKLREQVCLNNLKVKGDECIVLVHKYVIISTQHAACINI